MFSEVSSAPCLPLPTSETFASPLASLPQGTMATGEDWVISAGVCSKQRASDVGVLLQSWAFLSATVWKAGMPVSQCGSSMIVWHSRTACVQLVQARFTMQIHHAINTMCNWGSVSNSKLYFLMSLYWAHSFSPILGSCILTCYWKMDLWFSSLHKPPIYAHLSFRNVT